MYKGIIFDLDGTLLDTIDTIAFYGNKALEKYGFKSIETDKYKYFVGDGAVQLVQRMLAFHGSYDERIFEKVFNEYNTLYNNDTFYKTAVYDGINQLLKSAKEKGIKLAVLSNKPHEATIDVIKRFFGNNTFDIFYGAREGLPLKPDPTSAILLAKELEIDKSEIIYVGDTSVDMKTGKGAGFYSVGVLWGFRDRKELEESGADLIISHPSEILKLL